MLDAICRRRPGVSIAQARAEAMALAASLAAANPKTNRGVGATDPAHLGGSTTASTNFCARRWRFCWRFRSWCC